jgi:cation transport ATPase
MLHAISAGSVDRRLRRTPNTPGRRSQLRLCGVFGRLVRRSESLGRTPTTPPRHEPVMVLAVLGACALGDWAEAATVAFLFSLSLALEAWSVGRARRAVAALLELAPAEVRVKENGGDRIVPAAEVSPDAVFVVRRGQKEPLDGTVKVGMASISGPIMDCLMSRK